MLLQIEGLSLVSDQGVIVNHISFSIAKGEIVALTGKSGSGKTSIGLAILGLLPAGIRWQEGLMKWYGQQTPLQYPMDIVRWSALRGRHISYIQQDVFGIFDPVLRIGKQMTMIVKEIGKTDTSDIQSALRSKMKEVGISDVERVWNSYPHQLSGGQLQRCQICISIVLQPELIVADEPTSAIDKINQLEILDLLGHVRDQYQMAILCITHEESVVNYLADRCISLEPIDEQSSANNAMKIPYEGLIEKPILRVENLGFKHKFGGIFEKEGTQISNIDFTLLAGQCLGIIGESGSGKSTLAQLLVGLLIPSTGHIRIHNQEIDFRDRKDIRFLRSKIQLVMQDGRGSLHPNKTIRWLLQEVIDQQLKLDKNLKIDLVQILKEVGLPTQVLDRKESNLSGGECLRISIARALLMKPDILICDESTTSLDGPTRDGIIRLLLSLMVHQKLGLILIAHDDSLIRQAAHLIIVLDGGKVVEKGIANEILTNPQQPATKKILHANATLSAKKNL
ncbi:MAG: ATP-binding cassette domain-containing protein [Saprospiraceae bacterium]